MEDSASISEKLKNPYNISDTVLDFKKKCWGQLAPKFSFLVARTSLLVAKN